MENAKNSFKCGEKCRAICQKERNGFFILSGAVVKKQAHLL